MKTSLILSTVAHAGLIGYALFSYTAPRPLEAVVEQPLPIELVNITSVTKTKLGDEKAKPKDEPAPKQVAAKKPTPVPDVKPAAKPKPKAAPKPPEPEVAKAEPKPPKPEPEAQPKPLEPKPPKPVEVAEPKVESKPEQKAEPKAEPRPDPKTALPTRVATPTVRPRPPRDVKLAKAEAKPKRTEAKAKKPKSLPTDRIKALLDKSKPSGGARRSTETASLGTRRGEGLKMSASELDALRGQIRRCWAVQGGGGAGAETLKAKIEFRLDRSGALISDPVAAASGGDNASARRAFARSALRAVKRCAPYNLPADKYETWADVTVNFSLADML